MDVLCTLFTTLCTNSIVTNVQESWHQLHCNLLSYDQLSMQQSAVTNCPLTNSPMRNSPRSDRLNASWLPSHEQLQLHICIRNDFSFHMYLINLSVLLSRKWTNINKVTNTINTSIQLGKWNWLYGTKQFEVNLM